MPQIFLNFVYGLNYGLSKLNKRGKIIIKLWKIIYKVPREKLKNLRLTFCRPAFLLSFCENRLCLSHLIEKLNSTKRGALFDIFASPLWSALRMRTKVVSFFIFQELSNKKIKALRPKMTKIASKGSCLSYFKALSVLLGLCLDFSMHYSKVGCRRTNVLRNQARRFSLQAAFWSRSYIIQCTM